MKNLCPKIAALAAALAFLLVPVLGKAQTASGAPLRIVVPFLAGSGSDVVARLIGNELSQRLGQPVVVINQAGGSGVIATQMVQRADPDGNTLLLTTTNHVLLPTSQRDLAFDVVEDFAPIGQVSAGPLVIAANPDLPAKTFPELIAYAKANPGKISYATPGVGTVPHLAIELLCNLTGTKMVAIPYRGGPQAMTDVISGNVAFYLGTFASVLPYFDSGKSVPLAITSERRPSFIKNIPTIAEQGVPNYHVDYWYGFVAPRKTSPERIRQLNAEISAIATSPKVSEILIRQGFEPKTGTPEDFRNYMRLEVKRWAEVAKLAGVKPE